ncbi:MAG: histidinol phosphate phosphatase domain-containing protein [Methanobrevibacter sp.]|nr:histidinol phosphate phosphatase domain-containing protein [Candidatus Methanovirga basalitermitum]
MDKRIDLHMHSLFSDGELLPSELARRAHVLDHDTIAITDHIDSSNIETIPNLIGAIEDINDNWDINVLPGAEITHAPVEVISKLADRARNLGAKIVVVHGETLAEPVIKGTNFVAVECGDVDILAHPGLITEEEVEIAKKNNVTLEISGRRGHSLSNGHVAKIGVEVGADLIVDTDSHSPDDLITFQEAKLIGLGAGLAEKEVMKALVDNPKKIIKRRK